MITLFKKKSISRMTAMLVLLCLSAFSFNASAFSTRAADITLPAGTRIDLELISTINSASVQAGESVDFKVRADVLVDNNVVVRAGTIAKGTVVAANRAKGIGKEGNVEIQVKNVAAVDGKLIPLSGSGVSRKGEDNQTLAIVLGIFVCILFLMVKGKNGEIPAGTTTDAIVASNIKIAV